VAGFKYPVTNQALKYGEHALPNPPNISQFSWPDLVYIYQNNYIIKKCSVNFEPEKNYFRFTTAEVRIVLKGKQK
jgi:hypothetical protein